MRYDDRISGWRSADGGGTEHNLHAPPCEPAGCRDAGWRDSGRCVAAGDDARTVPVSEIMSRGILTAQPGDTVAQAAASMAREQIRRLPVTENDRVVGMVSLCDLARREDCRQEYAKAAEGISANLRMR